MTTCSYGRCGRPVYARGWCGGHYNQQRLGKPLRPLRGSPDWVADHLNKDGEKECSKCKRWLPVSEFYQRGDVAGLRAFCRRCNILRRMGITAADYDRLLAEQGGRCAICGATEEDNGRALCVDHDHRCCPKNRSCGECVRGLLCDGCNTGIGYMEDTPARLRNAADYLDRWNAR